VVLPLGWAVHTLVFALDSSKKNPGEICASSAKNEIKLQKDHSGED
jgi:hypothetical protein